MTPEADSVPAVPFRSRGEGTATGDLADSVPPRAPHGAPGTESREPQGTSAAVRIPFPCGGMESPLLRVPRVKRGEPAEVWVYLGEFRGQNSLHVRWMRPMPDGGWAPTTMGATIPAEHLAALLDAVRAGCAAVLLGREGSAP